MIAVGAARPRIQIPPPAPRRKPAPAVEPQAKRATPPPINTAAFPTNTRTSFSDRLARIAEIYSKVTGGKDLDRMGIVARLKDAFERCKRDGKPFTRKNFEKAFDTNITDAAWKAFSGRSPIYSERGLLSAFEHYEEFYIATNTNFEYFRGCTEITITPAPRQMRGFVARDRNRKAIFHWHKGEAKRILAYLKDRGFKEKLKGRDLERKLHERYDSLTPALQKKFNRLMGAALFNKLYLHALKKSISVDVLKGLHKDPLLSRVFTRTLFAKFVLGEKGDKKGVTKADFEAFSNTVKIINGLQWKVGERYAEIMDDFNPGSPKFKKLVSEYKSGASATQLRTFIKQNRDAMKVQTKTQPAGGPAIPVRVPPAPPKPSVNTRR
ncbi:MAG: hypothetical protein U9R38_02415 [Candidatus Margulisiibacteriota bacterium]|nr:hypothetical protein [Candidatus Margulisiibacteriota bacterium]